MVGGRIKREAPLLMRGRKWGRILSLTIFAAFGLVQRYLGLAYLATGGKSPFGPQNAAAAFCLILDHRPRPS